MKIFAGTSWKPSNQERMVKEYGIAELNVMPTRPYKMNQQLSHSCVGYDWSWENVKYPAHIFYDLVCTSFPKIELDFMSNIVLGIFGYNEM